MPAYVAVIAPHENDVVPVADCAADPQVRSLEQVEANAALIAAAPEMFAALEALIAGDGAARGLARAALAKATAPAPARWPLL